MPKTADAIINDLDLSPHPEGGWYREIHRSAVLIDCPRGARSALTTIYYLLERGQSSRWHTVEADEAWHFHDGAPLELWMYDPVARHLSRTLLAPPDAGVAAAVVPAGIWQGARSLGDYTLTGCSVGPGFDFADFHLVASLPGHAAHFHTTLDHLRDLL